MGIRTSYSHGQLSWVDLMTPDPQAAKGFYGKIFGWTFQDMDTPNGPYCKAYIDERTITAIFDLPQDMKGQGIPPHWQQYITVSDIHGTLESVEKCGGKVCLSAQDIPNSGTMASIIDPEGAVFNLWQPSIHIGAEVVNEPNTWCWSELNSRAVEQAKDFYRRVFSWQFERMEGSNNYWLIRNQDTIQGGIFDIGLEMPPEVPVHWLPSFNVQELDKRLELAESLGACIHKGPIAIPPGRLAIVGDPQGAVSIWLELKRWDP